MAPALPPHLPHGHSGEDEAAQLKAGDKVAVQYRFVAPYLASKKVSLR